MYEEYIAAFRAVSPITCLTSASFARSVLNRNSTRSSGLYLKSSSPVLNWSATARNYLYSFNLYKISAVVVEPVGMCGNSQSYPYIHRLLLISYKISGVALQTWMWHTHNWGGYDNNRCTWSLLTFPATICTSNSAHIFRIISLNLWASSPYRIGFRYFVIHTRCTFMSNRLWLPLLYSSIAITY